MEKKDSAKEKEELPILTILDGIIVLLPPRISLFVEVSMIALQFSRES